MSEYIIFGASGLGRIAYEFIIKQQDCVYAFCDNDLKKRGSLFCGINVISPDELKNTQKTIVIASTYHIFIARQLLQMGIKEFGCFYIKNYVVPAISYFNYQNISDFSEDEKKILFIAETFSGSNINAIYEYMHKNSLHNAEVCLINENERENNYYYDILTSKIIVKSYAGSNLEGKIIIQLWHSFLLKGLGFMGRFGSQDREYEHSEWSKLSKIISYSSFYNTLMSACYGIEWNKFEVTGMPRNDLLFRSNGKSYIEKIYGVSNKKCIIYMPTYRQTVFGQHNGSEEGYFYNAYDFDADVFNQFLIDNECMFFIKLHQTSSDQINDKLRNKSNIIIIDNQYFEKKKIDFYHVLNGFDLMVTDYSGVFFDFLLLDKPIVFTPYDLEDYIKTKGLLLEPYDNFTPGPKARNFKDVMREIKKSLDSPSYFENERKFIKEVAHHYDDGCSCERVSNAILKCIEQTDAIF